LVKAGREHRHTNLHKRNFQPGRLQCNRKTGSGKPAPNDNDIEIHHVTVHFYKEAILPEQIVACAIV